MSINQVISRGTTELFSGLGGKRVLINNDLLNRYNQLKAASGRQNHWAQCAVKGLMDVKSGRIGKQNMLVRPGFETKPGVDIFYVVLSGLTATMQRLDNDVYVIVDLRLDVRFMNQGKKKTATGLYRVVKNSAHGQWEAEFVKDGHLKPEGNPLGIVGISDGGYLDSDKAADILAGHLKPPASSGGKKFSAFEMHYTHNPGKFGGLIRYGQTRKPLSIESVHGSALMLASTMEQAKDIEDITWTASFGGSAVLTQAMKILADRNIKLDKHSAYLHRAQSDPTEAVRQAHRLELKLQRDFINTNPLDAGNGGQFGMIRARLMNPDDKEYKFSHAVLDFGKQAGNIFGGSVIAVSALAYAGVSMAVPGAAAPLMAPLMGIAAAIGTGLGTIKVGDTLLEGVAPRFYQKQIGQYK